MTEAKPQYKHPLLWVPTSYLAMGLVYVTVTSMSNIMFLNLGLPTKEAAWYSSALGLPYTLKPLWAPLLELYRTKKFWVVLMQFVLAGALGASALAVSLPVWTVPVIAFFGLCALAGATMDIVTDGVYVTTLPPSEQAKFTGFQSLFWSIGPILATGVFVRLSGTLYKAMGSYGTAWTIVMFGIAALVGLMGFNHLRNLPPGGKAADAPKSAGEAMATFGKAFTTFFQKRGIILMICFAFFYRFGLGLLDKIGPAFIIAKQPLSAQQIESYSHATGMTPEKARAILEPVTLEKVDAFAKKVDVPVAEALSLVDVPSKVALDKLAKQGMNVEQAKADVKAMIPEGMETYAKATGQKLEQAFLTLEHLTPEQIAKSAKASGMSEEKASKAFSGLGLSNETLGDLNGSVGTIAFMVASLLGGWLVARMGMKKSTLIVLVLALNVPNLTFVYLSQARPESLMVLGIIIFLEKFGWGFGAVGHMIYMMQQIAPGPYKTAHYAFATAFMGLCMMATGFIAGAVQERIGFPSFFLFVMVGALPSILFTLTAPFHHKYDTAPAK